MTTEELPAGHVFKAPKPNVGFVEVTVDFDNYVSLYHHDGFTLKSLAQLEKEIIMLYLKKTGSVLAAACVLKITAKTIYNKLRKWGLLKGEWLNEK